MHSSLEDAIRRGWRNDGSLPQGWECLQDENSGKQFFVDHNTQATSWVDPRDYLKKPHTFEDCYGDELAYGWEQAVDSEVGIYFINHNEWTTQLDDPRLYSQSNKHRGELKSFLHEGNERVRFLKQRARDIEARLKRAHQDLGALHSQLRLARMHGEDPDPLLGRAVFEKEAEIRQLEQELAQVQAEMEAYIQGLKQLTDIEGRAGGAQPYDLERAREALRNLNQLHTQIGHKDKERDELERAILDSNSLSHNNSTVQRELALLRQQQQQHIDQVKLEYEKLAQSQRNMYEQQINSGLREAMYRESSLKDLVHLKHEEKHQLEIATEKMKDLIAIHELQSKRLAERVEELQRENDLQKHRLDHILKMREREQDTIQSYVKQGIDLSFLGDYVSKAQLAEAIAQLRGISEHEKKELWREMEATSDVFMPKTRLETILNSHEAQLDELRRLLTMKPTDRPSARRVWNENLQTFEEVPPATTAPPAPVPAPKSSLELELDLAMARKELARLEKDVSELKNMRNSLIQAEEDQIRAAIQGAFGSRSDSFSGTESIQTADHQRLVDDVATSEAQSDDIGQASKKTLQDSDVLRARAKKAETASVAPVLQQPGTPVLQFARGPRSLASPGVNSASSDFLLDGEDWMLNPKTLDMLQVRQDSRNRIAKLREDAQTKVKSLRDKAKVAAHKLSIRDKMALFTTAAAEIHHELQDRESDPSGAADLTNA